MSSKTPMFLRLFLIVLATAILDFVPPPATTSLSTLFANASPHPSINVDVPAQAQVQIKGSPTIKSPGSSLEAEPKSTDGYDLILPVIDDLDTDLGGTHELKARSTIINGQPCYFTCTPHITYQDLGYAFVQEFNYPEGTVGNPEEFELWVFRADVYNADFNGFACLYYADSGARVESFNAHAPNPACPLNAEPPTCGAIPTSPVGDGWRKRALPKYKLLSREQREVRKRQWKPKSQARWGGGIGVARNAGLEDEALEVLKRELGIDV